METIGRQFTSDAKPLVFGRRQDGQPVRKPALDAIKAAAYIYLHGGVCPGPARLQAGIICSYDDLIELLGDIDIDHDFFGHRSSVAASAVRHALFAGLIDQAIVVSDPVADARRPVVPQYVLTPAGLVQGRLFLANRIREGFRDVASQVASRLLAHRILTTNVVIPHGLVQSKMLNVRVVKISSPRRDPRLLQFPITCSISQLKKFAAELQGGDLGSTRCRDVAHEARLNSVVITYSLDPERFNADLDVYFPMRPKHIKRELAELENLDVTSKCLEENAIFFDAKQWDTRQPLTRLFQDLPGLEEHVIASLRCHLTDLQKNYSQCKQLFEERKEASQRLVDLTQEHQIRIRCKPTRNPDLVEFSLMESSLTKQKAFRELLPTYGGRGLTTHLIEAAGIPGQLALSVNEQQLGVLRPDGG